MDKPTLNKNWDDQSVMQYLQQHPDFFIRNAQQVEQIRIPHHVRGSVSLVEWHLSRQRQCITRLEERIQFLVEQARANEKLFTQLLRLQEDLVLAESLHDLLSRFESWSQRLGLSAATLRLFDDRWRISPPSDFTHLGLARSKFELLRIQRLGTNHHYLGRLNGSERRVLLPEAIQVGSVALSLLGEQGDLGVVIFSSGNTQHYQAGMATDMLSQLAHMLPVLIERWIERI